MKAIMPCIVAFLSCLRVEEDLLNIFNPNELQILLSGQPFLNDDNSTILNTFLNDHIVYQMDNNAPIIQYFKEAIRRFTPNERSMVFRFWTGMTSLPPGGLDCLHPKCMIELSTSSTEMLPLATTCYNLLVIMVLEKIEKQINKLINSLLLTLHFFLQEHHLLIEKLFVQVLILIINQ